MLKLRLLTTLIVMPLFILAILYLPSALFAIASGLIVLGCAWEWTNLSRITGRGVKAMYLVVVSIFMVSAFVYFPFIFKLELAFFSYFAILLWVLACVAVLVYAKTKATCGLGIKTIKLGVGVVLLVAFWFALVTLQESFLVRFNALLAAFILIWSVDIGAYFVGRFLGARKLIAEVSPNKTWEGFFGGVGFCVFLALVIALIAGWNPVQSVAFALLALLTALFAVLGDLFESMLKRQVDVKDSGTLLPGHGGLLDRFDSAIAALPVFWLGLQALLPVFGLNG